eukprot:Mrub_04662.p1 GENE.Mrub_04662~~Mrub_04662.p1  ORF type:complete len:319 (-),score=9.56 Mrub_04662:215-1171(-)
MSKISCHANIINDRCLFLSKSNSILAMKPTYPHSDLYFIAKHGKSTLSAESRQIKTLNRLMRSTLRLLGISTTLDNLQYHKPLDNWQIMVSFARKVQRAVKDKLLSNQNADVENIWDKSKTGEHEPQSSTQLNVPMTNLAVAPLKENLSYVNSSFDYEHSFVNIHCRVDDYHQVLGALHKDYGVTVGQHQRLKRDVLHGHVSNQDYLTRSWQEYWFGLQLFAHLSEDASDYLVRMKSPYASRRCPENSKLSPTAYNNARSDALNSAKVKLLKFAEQGKHEIDVSYLYCYLWSKEYVFKLVDKLDIDVPVILSKFFIKN